jgi:hypothetical protein
MRGLVSLQFRGTWVKMMLAEVVAARPRKKVIGFMIPEITVKSLVDVTEV